MRDLQETTAAVQLLFVEQRIPRSQVLCSDCRQSLRPPPIVAAESSSSRNCWPVSLEDNLLAASRNWHAGGVDHARVLESAWVRDVRRRPWCPAAMKRAGDWQRR